MKIQLKILPHQVNVIKTVNQVFNNVNILRAKEVYQNPIIDISDSQISENIKSIQDGEIEGLEKIPNNYRSVVEDEILGLDIKMETGTGKTYCYTRLMYELNKNYGFNKFIILVPTTPIKEGTKNFILSDYAKSHFSDLYPGFNLSLEVLNPIKAKKGKKMFPQSISNFARGTRLEKGKINCLLMTDSMLLSKATMEKVYDQTLLGSFTVPYDALKNTKPIVIIDEPHKFKRENKAFKCLLEKLQPQMIVRFGATFPLKEKSTQVDYDNLIYNLSSCVAFNDGLVKGVAVQMPENIDEDSEKIKLLSITNTKPKTVVFRDEKTKKVSKLGVGDSLGFLNKDFLGITIDGIGKIDDLEIKSGVLLSNGQGIAVGDSVYASIYSDSYQEIMLKQAIKNHFRQEKENFFRSRKIKTLSLFFIDSIESYRGKENDGALRLKFEKLLADELCEEIKKLDKKCTSRLEKDYLEYLRVSLNDIKKTNGGYFAVDNSNSDEDIAKEVDLILRDKTTMLSFKTDNEWNTMRFIFSKWTLREGWDNPNVFQIVKLRSSGSEISKLQEVGRGLRLPVDEFGNRISDEEFYLTYLVDFSERDFADKLRLEINSDKLQIFNIKKYITDVAKNRGIKENALFSKLLELEYIDIEGNINEEKQDEFFNKYPEFNKGLRTDKIIDETKTKRGTVGIRKDRYKKIEKLWNKINQKYYLKLEALTEKEILDCISEILKQNIFDNHIVRTAEKKLVRHDNSVKVEESTVGHYILDDNLPYNEFLKKLHTATGISLQILHRGFVEYNKSNPIEKGCFTKNTVRKFILAFQVWMQKKFVNRFSYKKMKEDVLETALTDHLGNLKECISQGTVGLYRDINLKVPDTFLYDQFVYDSPKERETIKNSDADEVIVFGKIPRRSIQVPLYFGGTTSPDFMYVLKKPSGELEMNLIVETKDVNKDTNLREEEKFRIECAKKFFETMKKEGINISFRNQLKNDDIVSMIEEMLKK